MALPEVRRRKDDDMIEQPSHIGRLIVLLVLLVVMAALFAGLVNPGVGGGW